MCAKRATSPRNSSDTRSSRRAPGTGFSATGSWAFPSARGTSSACVVSPRPRSVRAIGRSGTAIPVPRLDRAERLSGQRRLRRGGVDGRGWVDARHARIQPGVLSRARACLALASGAGRDVARRRHRAARRPRTPGRGGAEWAAVHRQPAVRVGGHKHPGERPRGRPGAHGAGRRAGAPRRLRHASRGMFMIGRAIFTDRKVTLTPARARGPRGGGPGPRARPARRSEPPPCGGRVTPRASRRPTRRRGARRRRPSR